MLFDGWDVRQIYELSPDDLLEAEAFFSAFGQYRDINGHRIEVIKTRPKNSLLTSKASAGEHEGLDLADTVLILHSDDVRGITPGENLRVDGKLYRIMTVSVPIRNLMRLDLQGIDG